MRLWFARGLRAPRAPQGPCGERAGPTSACGVSEGRMRPILLLVAVEAEVRWGHVERQSAKPLLDVKVSDARFRGDRPKGDAVPQVTRVGQRFLEILGPFDHGRNRGLRAVICTCTVCRGDRLFVDEVAREGYREAGYSRLRVRLPEKEEKSDVE